MIPGYWMNETSGVLRPAVEAYLGREIMTQQEIAAMRAYLRQWIWAPAWFGRNVEQLRHLVDGLTSRDDIASWLAIAERDGIDPL
jgi:hypothetical protein